MNREHRLSTDLDIVVFPDQEATLWTMHAPSNTAFEKLTAQLATTGTRPWGDLDNPNQRRFERGGQHIDLFEARPIPRGDERLATVNGRAVKTLSTAQILHGKRARCSTGEGPPSGAPSITMYPPPLPLSRPPPPRLTPAPQRASRPR